MICLGAVPLSCWQVLAWLFVSPSLAFCQSLKPLGCNRGPGVICPWSGFAQKPRWVISGEIFSSGRASVSSVTLSNLTSSNNPWNWNNTLHPETFETHAWKWSGKESAKNGHRHPWSNFKDPYGAAHSPMGLKEFRMWSFILRLLAEPRGYFVIYFLHISRLYYNLEIGKTTFKYLKIGDLLDPVALGSRTVGHRPYISAASLPADDLPSLAQQGHRLAVSWQLQWPPQPFL